MDPKTTTTTEAPYAGPDRVEVVKRLTTAMRQALQPHAAGVTPSELFAAAATLTLNLGKALILMSEPAFVEQTRSKLETCVGRVYDALKSDKKPN